MITYKCPKCDYKIPLNDMRLYLVSDTMPIDESYEAWGECPNDGEVQLPGFDYDHFDEVDYDGITMPFRGLPSEDY